MSEKQFPYLPHTKQERQEMLKDIGVSNFEELIAKIPANLRVKELKLPDEKTELELSKYISCLADKNIPASKQISFLGGGSYHRYVPAVVSTVASRSEFATSYTPYQPEISQGTLQAIYEFQSVVCLLTAMDVANASMYDGPTACAEAMLMATRITNRNKIIFAQSINPEYLNVCTTYAHACSINLAMMEAPQGVLDPNKLKIDDEISAVVIQYPNFFGCLEELSQLEKKVHAIGALLIVITDPVSLGLLTPPGKFGADIVVGDAQSCGNYLSFGGPSAGYMATTQNFVRQLPGRLVGATIDSTGQRAFTLTLQTREQHIRRSKATSNICTNQSLNALSMLVYLCLLGPQGLYKIAKISLLRAHYLADKLCKISGVELLYKAPFVNEFAIKSPMPVAQLLKKLEKKNILGGIDLSKLRPDLKDVLLIAVTEMNSKVDLDYFADTMQEIINISKTSALPTNEKTFSNSQS